MSGSAQDVLLQADLHRENMAEYDAWVDYQDQLEDQADDDSLWGFIGSLFGAVVGFLVGGPAGMAMGMGIGGATAYYASAEDNYDENERFLARDVFEGGKFQSWETEELVDKAKDWNEEMYASDVLMTDMLAKIAMTTVATAMSGNTFNAAEKAAWKDMTFGEKIGSLGGSSPTDTGIDTTGTEMTTGSPQMPTGGGTAADPYLMDTVSVGVNTAKPLANAWTGMRKFGSNLWHGGKGMMGMGPAGIDSMGFNTLQAFNTQSKIARGDLTLEDLLMLNYADETRQATSWAKNNLIPDFSNVNKKV